MVKLLSIIKKDLQLLIRSKGSASIIVLGPLLVILLVGLGFNTSNIYKINIASYSPGYTELSESILDKLISDQFTVNKLDSQEECIASVKNGANHLCMIIPEGLSIDSPEKKSITFYVDYSRINLVYAILDSISGKIAVRSSEISLQLTQSLIDIIEQTESELTSKRDVLGSLNLNNELIAVKLDNIDKRLDTLSSGITTPGLDSAIENITGMVDSSNLTSSKKDYIKDNLALIESELSTKLTQIDAVKTDINNELISIDSITGSQKEDLTLIDSSVSSISDKISSIGIKNAATIVSPISTRIEPITASKSYLNYTFPTLLVLILSFVSIILASTLVISEKASNAFFRNSITPTKDIMFILAITKVVNKQLSI